MRNRARVALTFVAVATLASSAWLTVTRDSAVLARVRDLLARNVTAPCTIESAEFSFLGGLVVRGVTVHDPGDPLGPPLARVAEARLDYSLDLFGAGPHITDLYMRRPELRVVARPDGSFDALDILRPPADAPEPEVPPKLPALVVDGGVVEFGHPDVLAPGRTVRATGLVMRAQMIEGWAMHIRAHGTVEGVGQVQVDVRADREAESAIADVTLTDVVLNDEVVDMLPEIVTRTLRPIAPRARVKGALSLKAEQGRVTHFSGALDVEDAAALVGLQDADGLPTPEPLQLSQGAGRVEFREGAIFLRDVSARVLGSPIRIAGSLPVQLPGDATAGDRDRQVDVQVHLDHVAIGPDLDAHLPQHLRVIRSSYDLSGGAEIAIALRGQAPFPRVDATITVRDTSASYVGQVLPSGEQVGFPWRVDGLDGRIQVVGPRVDIDVRGRHGEAPVSVRGTTDLTLGNLPVTDVLISAEDVPLDADLRAGFRERADAIWGRWSPSGVAKAVTVRVAQGHSLPPRATATDVRIELDGRAAFRPEVLPAPLSGARGQVQVFEAPGLSRIWIDGFTARGDAFDISASGSVVTRRGQAEETLVVTIDASAAERSAIPALHASASIGEGVKRALRLLDPRGSLRAVVRRTGDPRGQPVDVDVELRGAAVSGWEGVPLAASGLVGHLQVSDDSISTDGLTGSVLGSTRFNAIGRLDGLRAGRIRPHVTVRADELPLGNELRTALGTLANPAAAFWETLAPAPDTSADALVVIRPDGDPAGPVDVDLDEFSGPARVLGFDLLVDRGSLRYRKSGVVAVLRGRLGRGAIDVSSAHVDPETGVVTLSLSARALSFPRDLSPLLSPSAIESIAAALPGRVLHVPDAEISYDPRARKMTIAGRVSLRPVDRNAHDQQLDAEGDLQIGTATIWLPEGEPATFQLTGVLDDARFHAGTRLKIDAAEVSASGAFPPEGAVIDAKIREADITALDHMITKTALDLSVRGRHVRLRDIEGTLHGGRFTGRVGFGGPKFAYAGEFELHDSKLVPFIGSGADGRRRGVLHAGVTFSNETGKPGALRGKGRADVRDGRLARVPGLTPVINGINTALLGVTKVEGEFHEAEMSFDLRGHRIQIRDLYLGGPNLLGLGPVEIRDGEGTISLDDGQLDVAVYPRIRFDPLGLDPLGILDRVMSAFQVFIGRLRIEGSLRNPRVARERVYGEQDEQLKPRPQPSGETLPYGPPPW